MSNFLEGTIEFIKTNLNNTTQRPLHIGEAMTLWTYSILLDEANAFCYIGKNTSDDQDIQKMLKDSIKNCAEQSNDVKQLMIKEGVPIPNATPPKPNSDTLDIPYGTKMSDEEIANGLIAKELAAINLCNGTLTQAIRNDVGAMFLKFYNEKVNSLLIVKTTMLERGWLKVPPSFAVTGHPNSSVGNK